MDFRNMMWRLFLSTGNLDAYLTYRACANPEECLGEADNVYYGEEFAGKAMIGTNES